MNAGVQATGSLMGDAEIICTGGDIDRLLIGGTIYGDISANGGEGEIKNFRYTDNTFRDPDTEQINLPRQHINARWE